MANSVNRFSGSRFERKSSATRPTGRVIAVAYDGEKTEAEYFRGWTRKLGTLGIVMTPFYVRSGGNADRAVRECKKEVSKNGPFDEVWCVSDVDDTSATNVEKARAFCKKNGIELCLSNRCFEIWLALHFGKISLASVTSEKEAVELVAPYCPTYTVTNKAFPFEELFVRSGDACDNAEWLKNQAIDKHWTDVHILVRRLIKLYNRRTAQDASHQLKSPKK